MKDRIMKKIRERIIRRLGCVPVWWKDRLPISADGLQITAYEITLIDQDHVRIRATFETGFDWRDRKR